MWGVSLALQRGERHERRLRGGRRGFGGRRLFGIQPVHPRTQLADLVSQLPVRFAHPLEPLGDMTSPGERRHGRQNRSAGEPPLKGQQNSYLIERLATVSTA